MTDPVSLPPAVVRALRAEVRQEIRLAALLDTPTAGRLPPPSDLDTEQVVASAVLSNAVRPSELRPLTPRHFYSPLYAAIFAICDALHECGTAPTVALALATLQRQGCVGEELEAELHTIRDATPFVVHIQQRAQRLLDLAAARALLARITRIDALLRVGELSAEAAMVELCSPTDTHGGGAT